jgi:sn-glycerol 3-phosphate transport system permease protein
MSTDAQTTTAPPPATTVGAGGGPGVPPRQTAARPRPRPSRASRTARRTLSYVLLTVGAVFVLFPLYMAVVTSLLTPAEYGHQPPLLWPPHPQWHVYVDAFTTGHMGHYLLNSLIQSTAITVGTVLTSLLAAYAFAYLDFPLKRTLFVVVIATLMIPFEVTATANFQTITRLHAYGTTPGLILPFLAGALGIFLLRQAFLQVPRELRDAAFVDGYGELGFLWRVATPLVRPMLATLSVITFLGAWNQYLWPLLMTADNEGARTVQIGIRTLYQNNIQSFGEYLAGTVIGVAPLLIALVFFQRQLVANLHAGAVK